MEALALTVQKLLKSFKFFKKQVKLKGQGHMVKSYKCSVTRNTHVKYKSSSTCCSKVINKVRVFEKQRKLQGQKYWFQQKCLVTRNIKWKIKAVLLPAPKALANLSFRQNY